jgi:hypothetical protein
LFDINNQEYILYLCQITNKTPICLIEYSDISISRNFRQFSELSFEVPYYDNGWIKTENKTFNLLQPNYLILLETRSNDEIINTEYFIINQPSLKNDNGEIKKSIQCYSLECLFNNRYLTAYEDVRALYDPNNNYNLSDSTKGGVLNYILESMRGIWQVDYVSPSLLGIYHSFNYSSQTYRSVIEDLESVYNCIFVFDTVNNKISIYTADEIGENTEIVLTDENFIKSLSCDIKNSEICTMLRVYGKNNITISDQNPTGTPWEYDFSYFLDNGYLSDSLSSALTTYNNLVESKEGDFTTYLSSLNTLRSTLLTRQNELNDLNTTLKTIEDSLAGLQDIERRNSSSYGIIYNNKIAVKGQITDKENEIIAVEGQINTVLNNISTLNSSLSLENNFTSDQLKELNYFIFESTLKLDSVDNSQLLYKYAKQYIKIKSIPPYDFTIDIVDLFSINDKYIIDKYNKIKVGNFIYIDCPELGFNYEQFRITQISHNKLSNSLSITVSNKDKINTELYYLDKILTEVPKEVDSLKIKKEDYSKYVEESNKILYNNSTIDVENNPIIAGNNFLSKRGFQGKSLGTRNGAIKIQGDQIIFSKDGDFKDYYALLSPDGLFLERNDGKSRTWITPENGFQIDVFNPTTSDFRNAIYLGMDSLQNPALYIDNGFIEMTYVSRQTGANVNQIKINPELGMVINKWDTNILNWIPVFYTSPNGTVIANELIATDAIIQGNFSTGFTKQPRVEINNNGIISYNSNDQKHGLYINSARFTDLFLYRTNEAIFGIYDNGDGITLYCGEKGVTNEILIARPSSTGSSIDVKNEWDFSGATVTNLSGYAEESYVDGNFATSLSYDSTTGVLSLKNANGSTIDTVTLT